MLFLQKVWEFIKKYWQLFAGLAVGLLLFLFSLSRRAPGPSPVQQKAEDKARKEEEEAAKVRDQKIEEAKTEHDVVVEKTITDEKKKEPALEADPKATNDFLNQVGKDIRGG